MSTPSVVVKVVMVMSPIFANAVAAAKQRDHECEEEVCTHCGGTGVEPKKDIVEDTNFEGIDNVLRLNA